MAVGSGVERSRTTGAGTVRKAVILARGLGTRMRRADHVATQDSRQAAVADTGLKAMIPVGRPFLDYVLSALADAGIADACLVVGPEHGEVREHYTRRAPPERLRVHFAIQERPRGTADAVASAEAFAGRDVFLMLNSDNYYPVAALTALAALRCPAVAAFERDALVREAGIAPERVGQFSVLDLQDGWLRRLVEKPDEATLAAFTQPVYVGMNCFAFGPAIFEACRAVGPSPRGELELTDAVRHSIDVLGERYRALTFALPVLDLSTRADIAQVAARLRGVEVHP